MRDLNKIWLRVRSWIMKFLRRRSFATFCLFLLFATILWFGHALNSVRERNTSIEIEYLGVPDNVVFTEPLPLKFDIKIRDQGKRLFYYKKGVLQPVQIDLSSQLQREKGNIIVTSEQVRQRITDQLQGTAKLQLIKPDVISSDYYKQSSKKVKLIINGEVKPSEQYQFTSEPQLSEKQITIFGRKEQLDTIRQIETEHIKVLNIKDTIKQTVGIRLPEGITAKTSQVELYAVAERFTEKHFVLPIMVKEVPKNMRVITFPSSVEVKMQVPMSQFAEWTDSDMEAWCNNPQKDEKQLKVNVRSTKTLPKDIKVYPPTVEYIIEK